MQGKSPPSIFSGIRGSAWAGFPLILSVRHCMDPLLSIVALLLVAILALPALWATHLLLGHVCVVHARRYCRRSGLEPCRFRWQPEFDRSGMKTEATLVQLECLDETEERRLVLLSVWPFGVRNLVSNEPYAPSYDVHWPRAIV